CRVRWHFCFCCQEDPQGTDAFGETLRKDSPYHQRSNQNEMALGHSREVRPRSIRSNFAIAV
ncbi:MAG: hypothetical protein ACREQV_03130, partial [Candidatus Binatia bacterium]